MNQIPPAVPSQATAASHSNSNNNNLNINSNLASSQANNSTILTSNSANLSNLTSAQSVNALSSSQNSVDRLVARIHLIDTICRLFVFDPIQSNSKWQNKLNSDFWFFSCCVFDIHGNALIHCSFTRVFSTLRNNNNNNNEYSKSNLTMIKDEYRQSTFSLPQDRVAPLPRNKKMAYPIPSGTATNRTTPMPPPRRANSQQRFVFYSFFMIYLFFRFLCFCFDLFLLCLILFRILNWKLFPHFISFVFILCFFIFPIYVLSLFSSPPPHSFFIIFQSFLWNANDLGDGRNGAPLIVYSSSVLPGFIRSIRSEVVWKLHDSRLFGVVIVCGSIVEIYVFHFWYYVFNVSIYSYYRWTYCIVIVFSSLPEVFAVKHRFSVCVCVRAHLRKHM